MNTAEYAVGWYTARLTALSRWLGDADAQVTTLSGRLGSYGVIDPLEV